MISDRELSSLRAEYCALLSRLFLTEADAELMGVLLKDVRARARASEEMGESVADGWRQLGEICEKGSPEEWAERCNEEFLLLFVGPGVPLFTPCESHYLSGRAYGPSLGAVREFMGRAGLEPVNESHEPEDHIAFEFQILRLLIEKQAEGKDPDEEAEWLGRQGEFVRSHLGRWAPKFFQDVIENENTVFFEAFAKIGMGCVAWESGLLEDWGPRPDERELLKIQTDRPYKGPLFNADAPNPELIEEGPEEPPIDDEDPLLEGDLRIGK